MEEKVKNRYVIGSIGALIGAVIGSIPWILSYVFANMIYAILSVVIVVCAFYGYKLTKAKMDKKLPVILSIVSFIAITVTMLVAIPLIYMAKEGVTISFETFRTIYQIEEVSSVILTDYVISLIFCTLVIGCIIYNLNKQIKHGVKVIRIITKSVENEMFSNEDIEKAREVFERNDALSKKNPIAKELIVEDLQREFGQNKGSRIFEYLRIENIIKKKSNKYYFSEKAQNSPYYRYEFTNVKIFIIVLIIAVAIAALMYFTKTYPGNSENANTLVEEEITPGEVISSYTIENTDITLNFEEDMIKLSEDQIAEYYGKPYAAAYDAIITSEDFEKMIMIIQNNKSGFDEGYTAKQFLEDIAAEYEEAAEVVEKEIGNKTFYVLEREYESEEIVYLEQDYIYDSGDTFVCIIFDNPKESAMNPEKIIK